jgi:hypothetical protein
LPRSSRATITSSDKVASCMSARFRNGRIIVRATYSMTCILQVIDAIGRMTLALHPIPQNTDLLDLELNAVAMLEKPSELEAAPLADLPEPINSPGISVSSEDMCSDDLLEREQHAFARALRMHFAVHPR